MTASDPFAATLAAVADLPPAWRWPMANRLRDTRPPADDTDLFGEPCLSDAALLDEIAARTDWGTP